MIWKVDISKRCENIPNSEGTYVYPRTSLFDTLGEQMIFYAKYGQKFSIAVLLLMLISPWVIFPINWMANHIKLRNSLVALCIIIGLTVLVLGIIMFVLFILYLIKLNDVAISTRNGYLRKVFIMELVSMSVFISLNLAGNIIVPVIGRRVDSFEIFNLYVHMPGLTFYLLVLVIESILPRFFKVSAISNLKKWSDNLGVLLYDEDWERLKSNLRIQLKRMKIGQCFGLIPVMSFIIPIIYYVGLERTGRLFQNMAPHIQKNQ